METAQSVLLYCTLLNYGLLIVWCVVFRLAHDWHFRLTKVWFPRLTVEQYDVVNFSGIAIYKLAILLFNLIPYIALRLTA